MKTHPEHNEETSIGHELMNVAYHFLLIEANLRFANKPHTFFQVLKYLLQVLACQDPNKFHFAIARRSLTHPGNERAVDMLARALVKAFQKLNELLQWPSDFAKQLKYQQTSPEMFCTPSYLNITEIPDANEKLFFTKNGLTLWDSAYIQLLASFGATGKSQAEALTKKMQTSNTNTWDPLFWLQRPSPETESQFFYTGAFSILANILWEDIVEPKITQQQRSLIQARTSPKITTIEIKQHVQLVNGIELLSTIQIPTELKEVRY